MSKCANDPNKHDMHLIDFGLSKSYIRNGKHIDYKEGKKGITGTARYCSLATHMGQEQSRRDDLETIGHCLLYFLKDGWLPWIGVPGATKEEKYQRIKEIMFKSTFNQLFEGLPT